MAETGVLVALMNLLLNQTHSVRQTSIRLIFEIAQWIPGPAELVEGGLVHSMISNLNATKFESRKTALDLLSYFAASPHPDIKRHSISFAQPELGICLVKLLQEKTPWNGIR